jgi:hypothetical protein
MEWALTPIWLAWDYALKATITALDGVGYILRWVSKTEAHSRRFTRRLTLVASRSRVLRDGHPVRREARG